MEAGSLNPAISSRGIQVGSSLLAAVEGCSVQGTVRIDQGLGDLRASPDNSLLDRRTSLLEEVW